MKLEDLGTSELLDHAQRGDPEAQFLLGSVYYAGTNVRQDLPAAANWYEKAALQGHAKSQFNLGYMYSLGEGRIPDEVVAMKWYRLAAEQGLPVAQHNLARALELGQLFEEAAYWYRCAADQGDANAQASLGFALSQGRGVPVDEAGAIRYYRMAADQGSAQAQVNLAAMYSEGRGAHVDPGTAVHWARLAAKQGLGTGQTMLGDFYVNGFGVVADAAEGAKWLTRAAVQGVAKAQNSLAILYATGNGVAKDQVRAFMWFSAASSNGSSDAADNKDRVPIDTKTAVCELISAAAAGEAEAQRDLGLRLHHGDGVQQDLDASRYWIHKAAESGDPWSQTMHALGMKRSAGPDVASEQVRWLSRAAEQGYGHAQFNLGLRQIIGEGTSPDFVSGAANLIQASLSGYDEARPQVEEVRSTVRDEERSPIFDRVKWPTLELILGPLVEGHLDQIRISQENDDGSEDADWLKYERDDANAMFLTSSGQTGSWLDTVFNETVTIKQISVDRLHLAGMTHTAITISLRNVHLADGFPVYWAPSHEGWNAVAKLIATIGGRTWVRAAVLD